MDTRAVALRTLVLRSLLVVTALAVALLAVPLAWYVQSSNTADAVSELEQEATRVVALVPEGAGTLPAPRSAEVTVGLYDAQGVLTSGTGPRRDEDASGALEEGSTRVKRESGELAVYVPFERESGGRTTVRAVMPLSVPQGRTYRAWGLLLLASLLAFAVAALVAVRRSRQLARPFERIAEAAHQMRGGSLSVAVPPTGIVEGDEVARMLEEASASAAQRITDERRRSQETNHQVRTPVAAAQVTLESALAVPGSDLRQAAGDAVAQLDRASRAIDEVLTLDHGERPTAVGPAGPVLTETARRWSRAVEGTGRALVAHVDDEAAPVPVAVGVLSQCLDVLLDNAIAHGAGTVRVDAREAGGSLVVDVGDEGTVDAEVLSAGLFERGTTTRADRPGGHGLALARSLAESRRGRLLLASSDPARFTLLLPAEDEADMDEVDHG